MVGLTRARSKEDYFWIILPSGLLRQLWLLGMLLAVLWNIIMVPYSIFFIWGQYKLDNGILAKIPFANCAPVLFVDYFLYLIFLADTVLGQRLAFVDDQGIMIKDQRVIRARHIRTKQLLRGICAVVPIDLVLFVAWDWCPLLRLNRLIHGWGLNDIPQDLLTSLNLGSGAGEPRKTLSLIHI